MAFESLSYRYTFNLPDFPGRWLPLIHLYDPDLPLFPIYYFHVLPDNFISGQRPSDTERAFGYVEKINLVSNNSIDVTVILNKDLNNSVNNRYLNPVINVVRERFGISNPVTINDVQNVFSASLGRSNRVLSEIWQRVVSNAYGNKLGFGRLWDEVLGLTRYVASWYSRGRKGELIQTHYFASKFGVRIQSAGAIPQVDFYLLPVIQEVIDRNNPLTSFSQYSVLVRIAEEIHRQYCSIINVSGTDFSKFSNPFGGRLDTEAILRILNNLQYQYRGLALECFNSFNKGPQRTIIFLLMLDDIRKGRLKPASLNSVQCGAIHDSLRGTYQARKTIEIYAQQSFGNPSAMPVDTWIETFFKWPLNLYPTGRARNVYQNIFSHAQNLGKVERLLWVAGQARKVHSSACNDALWCLKKGSTGEPRGANPLACNICLDAIRNCCPAYDRIRNEKVCFNCAATSGISFAITTSRSNNTTPNQTFVKCEGLSIYNQIVDDFSPADDPDGFAPFPDSRHGGTVITVDEFVRIY